jgi:transposase
MSRAKIRAAVHAIRSDVSAPPTYTALLGKISRLEAELADRDLQIAAYRAELRRCHERIAGLEAVIEELRAKFSLNRDSHNSNQPPSADDPYRKPKPAPRHVGKTEKRAVGGQAGHTGATLTPRTPDIVIEHPLPALCQCGATLSAELVASRQVFDLPAPRIEVTEHRTYAARCACGAVHQSQFPPQVTAPVQYGEQIRAHAAYLSQHQMVSVSRTAQILSTLTGAAIAASTVQNAINEVIAAVAPAVDLIRAALLRAPVVHADESGCRVGGSLFWLHAMATDSLTYCDVHPQRGTGAIEAIGILPTYRGILVHDGFFSYKNLLECEHALCNAHHLRELVAIAEATGELWAIEMSHLLIRACHRVHETQAALGPEELQALLANYRRLLEEGESRNPKKIAQKGRPKQSPATCLLARLRDSAHEVLRFASNPLVPFTNNTAEQTVRMPKVKLKIAGCFRTLAGARGFAAIRPYLSTLQKQNRDLVEALILALRGSAPNPVPDG